MMHKRLAQAPLQVSQQAVDYSSANMSRDVSAQTDFAKFAREADGSFKRAPSSFRSWIQPGGDFEPEAGALVACVYSRLDLSE